MIRILIVVVIYTVSYRLGRQEKVIWAGIICASSVQDARRKHHDADCCVQAVSAEQGALCHEASAIK